MGNQKFIKPKQLTLSTHSSGGRNIFGRITAFHRGGGSSKRYRVVDFHRQLYLPGKIVFFEKDPARSCFLALVFYSNGILAYILSTRGMVINSSVFSSPFGTVPFPGCSTTLSKIPRGKVIHGVESCPNFGASLSRSAGASSLLMKHNYASSTAIVKLRSGEHRRISIFSWASYGRLSNSGHKFNVFTKAGHSRWIGKRPVVRGEAMNPVDHPHGGNTSGGTYPRTPWGKLAKGIRTRSKRNFSNSLIVRSRHLFKK